MIDQPQDPAFSSNIITFTTITTTTTTSTTTTTNTTKWASQPLKGEIQGIQLQMPQKDDVLLKKYCAKARGKIIYGLSIVWHLLYCFGNDIKYNFCSHIKKTKTLAFLIKIHNFVRKSEFLSFCLNKFLIELIYFEEDQKQ